MLGNDLLKCRIDEFDAATAVMGCAPADPALAGQAIADAGARNLLDEELARELVVETTADTWEAVPTPPYSLMVPRAVACRGRGGRTAPRPGWQILDAEGVRDAFDPVVRVRRGGWRNATSSGADPG